MDQETVNISRRDASDATGLANRRRTHFFELFSRFQPHRDVLVIDFRWNFFPVFAQVAVDLYFLSLDETGEFDANFHALGFPFCQRSRNLVDSSVSFVFDKLVVRDAWSSQKLFQRECLLPARAEIFGLFQRRGDERRGLFQSKFFQSRQLVFNRIPFIFEHFEALVVD